MIKDQFRKQVAKKKAYVPGKPTEELKREYGVDRVIKLASNENPLGPSPLAAAAVRAAAAEMNIYPDDFGYELKAKLAKKHGVEIDNVALGNGGTELLKMFAESFINEGDEAVMPAYTYGKYATEVEFLGGVSVKVPTKEDFQPDIDAMIRAVTPKTKLLFLCSPNNPTGNIVTAGEVEKLVVETPQHVTVVLDEAYYDYACRSGEYGDSLKLLPKREGLIVLRTFSKVAGLAGARIGYALACKEIIGALNRTKLTFGVNNFALAAAMAALDDQEHLKRTVDLSYRSMKIMEDSFERMGLHYIKSCSNFVFVDTKKDGREVNDRLLHRGIIIRGGFLWGCDSWIRISTGTEEDTAAVMKELEAVLNEM